MCRERVTPHHLDRVPSSQLSAKSASAGPPCTPFWMPHSTMQPPSTHTSHEGSFWWGTGVVDDAAPSSCSAAGPNVSTPHPAASIIVPVPLVELVCVWCDRSVASHTTHDVHRTASSVTAEPA